MDVKICGIRTKAAALAAAKAGADFLGFNFVFSSKRKIEPIVAQKIIRAFGTKKRPVIVGVFMNQSADYIKSIISKVKPDMLQFHGQESPKFCASFGLPYIKAFGVDGKTSASKIGKLMSAYKAKYFMLDRKDRGAGPSIEPSLVKKLASKFPIILAGGLNFQNVATAIAKGVKIFGVDIAGGVESNGYQDEKKIKRFIVGSKFL